MVFLVTCPNCGQKPDPRLPRCSNKDCRTKDDLLFPPLDGQKYVKFPGSYFRVPDNAPIITSTFHKLDLEYTYVSCGKAESRNGQDIVVASFISLRHRLRKFDTCLEQPSHQRVMELLGGQEGEECESHVCLPDVKDFLDPGKLASVDKASTEKIKEMAKETEKELLEEIDGWKTKAEEIRREKAKEAQEAKEKMEDLENMLAEKDREIQLYKDKMTKEMAEVSKSYEMKISSLTDTLQIAIRMAAKNDASSGSKTPAVIEAEKELTELKPLPKVEDPSHPTVSLPSKSSSASDDTQTVKNSASAPNLVNEERAGSRSSKKIANMGYDGCVESVNA